jgi:hypothetical protein
MAGEVENRVMRKVESQGAEICRVGKANVPTRGHGAKARLCPPYGANLDFGHRAVDRADIGQDLLGPA